MGVAEDAAVMVTCNKGYMVQVTPRHFMSVPVPGSAARPSQK